ncbi:hypothetical protein [Deinococcus apachensis]|uniref:hypothetical protein n=1 Tax=Deinococcus apachensis TaxID=309886 RepID=UPI0012F921EC|nr:hypothetical protein [Deinococcus apachensis]
MPPGTAIQSARGNFLPKDGAATGPHHGSGAHPGKLLPHAANDGAAGDDGPEAAQERIRGFTGGEM